MDGIIRFCGAPESAADANRARKVRKRDIAPGMKEADERIDRHLDRCGELFPWRLTHELLLQFERRSRELIREFVFAIASERNESARALHGDDRLSGLGRLQQFIQ